MTSSLDLCQNGETEDSRGLRRAMQNSSAQNPQTDRAVLLPKSHGNWKSRCPKHYGADPYSGRARTSRLGAIPGAVRILPLTERLSLRSLRRGAYRPRSKRRSTDESNLALSCLGCKSFKGAFQTGIDPVTEREVPLFHPHLPCLIPHLAQAG